MEAWLQNLNVEYPWLLALIRVVLLVLPILLLVPGCIWWERRFLSWMQDRVGPNRVGTITLPSGKKIRTFGILQPIADGVKLFLKEDATPSDVDRLLYVFAPALALFPAFMLGGTLPWGPDTGAYGYLTPVWNPEVGLLYILAISSLGVYGVVLAGYASNNKYSLLGGLRSAAQLISYELAMSVSLACVVLSAGSLKLTEMVNSQATALYGAVPAVQNWNIFTPFGFLAFVIFFICMVAETNRAPFDLPEAENEIIAGYHTEYASMKFAVFFMGEYAAMLIFAGVMSVVFMGGYHPLPIRWDWLAEWATAQGQGGLASVFTGIGTGIYWLAPVFFLAKMAVGLSLFIWLRATLPRLRYDQLMALGWKVLLPAAVGNFIVVMIWIIGRAHYGNAGGWGAAILALLIVFGVYKAITKNIKLKDVNLQRRKVDLSEGVEGAPTRRSIELV